MSRKTFVIIAILIIAIGIGAGTYIYLAMSKRPELNPITVGTADVQETIRLDGAVKSAETADLGFEKGGKIIQLNVSEGDKVSAGTVLARIDSQDALAQYTQSQAQAASAQAVLDQYNENLKAAKYTLDKIEKSDTSTHQDKQIQQKQIDSVAALVKAQTSAVAAAQNNEQYYAAQLQKTTLTAPFDGVVARKNNEVGETVSANTPVITLISGESYQIEAYASQTDAPKIHEGDTAEIDLKASDIKRKANGKVISVDSSETMQNGVPTYKITLEFDSDDLAVKPGAEVAVFVLIDQKSKSLAIPESAIIEQGGKNYVEVQNGKARELKPIETGINTQDGMVEVVSGLSEGEVILSINSN